MQWSVPDSLYAKEGESSSCKSLGKWQTLLLVLIVVVGASLRLFGVNWDAGTLPHPDERSTVAFYAPSIRWPREMSVEQAVDPRQSRLNPFWDVDGQHRRSYTYGHFPLYTLVLTAEAVHSLLPAAEQMNAPPVVLEALQEVRSPAGYAYLGRILVALADTVSVFLLFLLGRRLYGAWAGLLAAALSAFTVLQIQLSHFFAVDPVSTTFTLLAIFGAIRMADTHRGRAAVMTGLGIGLAVASKYSALPIVAAPVVAMIVDVSRMTRVDRRRAMGGWLLNLVVTGGVALLVFAATSPFVFLDFQSFWQAVVVEQGNMVRGTADFPFTRQYRGTLPYLYFLEQQVLWGMGIPLGILSILGFLWVAWRALQGSTRLGEWVVLSWLLLYFGPTGLFLAKFMRYMAPVVPLLILLGAGFALYGRRERLLGRFEVLRTVIVALVVATAALWSVAFVVGVYGTEHSWVTASRWVYENVPDGSCVAVEHWEEGFPRTWPESGMSPAAHGFRQPLLPMYEEDTRQKFETIRDTLKSCDYVVLASNRLWRTIPCLELRYPMSTAYYDYLFDGRLGFELQYTHETPPRIGPFVIDDQSADESFTVYDHPRPMVFRKTRQLSDEEWEALLGTKWMNAVPNYVGPTTLLARLFGEAASPRPGSETEKPKKSLMLSTPVDELPVVDDYHWNKLANGKAWVAIIFWWIAFQLIGWISWPLSRRVFSRLPDRGYLLSKSLGWLLLGFAVWFFASWRLLPNRLATIGGVLALLTGVGIWLFHRDRAKLVAFWQRKKGIILVGEGLFTLSFLFFVGLRLLNPDLWQPWNGGEKMLEIGFLHAIAKSAYMPPYDPFFAGGYINYYYYGLFLVGIMVKLTGIQPTVAFNLAVPTLAALTVANVFSLAFNLTLPSAPTIGGRWKNSPDAWRGLIAGLLAVLIVVFAGNLAGFEQLVHMLGSHGGSDFQSPLPVVGELVRAASGLGEVVDGVKLPPYNYWDPTRAIPDTINEFPYFSFIFADLHPHMIGLPFTVLLLSLALTWLGGERGRAGRTAGSAYVARGPVAGLSRILVLDLLGIIARLDWELVLRWLVLPLCLGALAVINTWDLPTYLGVVTTAFWLQRFRTHTRVRDRGAATGEGQAPQPRNCTASPAAAATIEALGFGGLTLAFSYLMYLPFFSHYQPLDVGIGLVHDKTDISRFVSIWGLFLFVVVTYLVVSLVYPNTRLSGLRLVGLLLRRWNVAPRVVRLQRLCVKGYAAVWAVLLAVVGSLVVGVVLWELDYRVPAVVAPSLVVAVLLLLRVDQSDEEAFIGLLVFVGLAVLLGVEIFFLKDFLGGSSYYRMNTLFKFYIQVWVMLGIALGCLLVLLWGRALHWQKWVLAVGWQLAIVLLAAASLVYPVLGTRTRIHDRFDETPEVGTLDGMAYMTAGTLRWPQNNEIELVYDYEAIRWLQRNVRGTPVVAEAKIGYYREGGMRVAAYTGLPTPLGGLHQSEQRPGSEIAPRDSAYMEFWNTPSPERAWQLIQDLDISYVYLGQLEKTLFDPAQTEVLRQWGVTNYSPQGRQKFDALLQQGRLKPVFQNERTEILAVVK
jgi:YYY domain-containing protein